jgi:hypothetical protein
MGRTTATSVARKGFRNGVDFVQFFGARGGGGRETTTSRVRGNVHLASVLTAIAITSGLSEVGI